MAVINNRLASFVVALSVTLLAGVAGAAVVKKISKKKKMVLIDAGKIGGFPKGTKVCFFKVVEKDGVKKSKKAACGVVRKAGKNKAMVRVKKRIKRIRKGFVVLPRGQTPEMQAAATGGSRGGYFGIKFLWLPTTIPQATYSLLSYNGAHAAEGESLWKVEGAYASPTLVNAGGEIELNPMGLRLGGRFKQYVPYEAIADYDPTNPALFISSRTEVTAFGGYLEYGFLFGSFSVGIGLDADITNLTLTGTRKDDQGVNPEEVLYSATGAATILSARIPVRYDPHWGAFGITMGLNLLVPVAAVGLAVNAEAVDPVNGAKNPDLPTDMSTALALTKASFSYELALGMFLAL